MLDNAKWLIKSYAHLKIKICKCLTVAELQKVKLARSECDLLNSKTIKGKDGKNKYFVINGSVMERRNGKIFKYCSDAAKVETQSESLNYMTSTKINADSKNVMGGSL